MKKSTLWLLMIAVILTMVFAACSTSTNTGGATDDSMDKIKQAGKFVVGLDDTFAPMGFRDEKGEIVGFDIDLAKEAAKRMGVDVEFKPVEWDGIIMSLNNGDIDVIWNGLTITESREKEINFTKPYMSNRQIIMIKKGSPIKGKEDLADKVVGVQMNSSSDEALTADKKTADSLKEIRRFQDNATALMDLSAGRLDAVVVDEILGRYYMTKKPDEYDILEDNFGEEQYGIGVRKSDIAFLEQLNKVMDEMKADGTASEISKKWFGEDIVLK
ncbi:MAG: amino acid transporter substrate-binding protein [Mahella sp.]|nr:amino acid ABC transporter substrate-binding protein [Mahella sp.]MBZ4665879.1 amino acid transporter substrate-binding protein [Mahella sp.]